MLNDWLSSPILSVILAVWAMLAATAGVFIAGRARQPRDDSNDDSVRRMFRNSAIPIASQIVVRLTDLGLAVALLRLLGPAGNGQYAIAVIVWLYVKTISDFGLSLLATRDIARDHRLAGRIVGETTVLRLIVLAMAGAPVAVYVAAGLEAGSLSRASAAAIGLLYLSIVPASYSEAVNAALNGFERMEIGAWLNIMVNLARAPLALLLAASRFGIAGVAFAALLSAILSAMLYRQAFVTVSGQRAVWALDRVRALALARESWPLLVNALLVNLFFRVDVFFVQAHRGDTELGRYDAAFKLINLATIIPAYVSLAIFPAMSRRADNSGALLAAQRASSCVLAWVAWAIVAVTSAGAGTAIFVLAGDDYLPEAAVLLRLLVWFAPLSFLNGVIQYVLVAAGEQGHIVPAFAAAVAFNVAANALFVPVYGARAAAFVTVLTECVILAAFAVVTSRRSLRVVSVATLSPLWRPTVTGVISAVTGLALADRHGEVVAIAATLCLFLGTGAAVGGIGPSERDLIRRAIGRKHVLAADAAREPTRRS